MNDIINTLIRDGVVEKYLYVQDNVVKRTSSLDSLGKNCGIDSNIVNVSKVINSKLALINNVENEDVNKLYLQINNINKKIDKHNSKIKGIFFSFLRLILSESLSIKIGISFAEKISCSAATDTIQKLLQESRDAKIDDLSGSLPTKLEPCSLEEKENILTNTTFVEHKAWKGKTISTTITSEMVKNVGLEPAFKITVNDNECYISKVFQAIKFDEDSYQFAAIAYVKGSKEDKFTPRLIYYSETNDLWRVSPIKEGYRIGKGLESMKDTPVKSSTNIPFNIGLTLSWMAQNAKDDTFISWTEENKDLLKTIYYMIPDNTLNYMEGYKCNLETKNATKDFNDMHKIQDLDLIGKMKHENTPDFTRIQKYSIEGSFLKKNIFYRTYSLDNQYEYVFCEASSHDKKELHPWLVSVSLVKSELSTYLTPITTINPRCADLSDIEFWCYVKEANLPDGFEDKLNSEGPGLNSQTRVATWEIRKNFEILKLFEAWKNPQ